MNWLTVNEEELLLRETWENDDDGIDQGCPTYGLRARIWPARSFHPAREAYEAY